MTTVTSFRTWATETAAYRWYFETETISESTKSTHLYHLDHAAAALAEVSPYGLTPPELTAWLNVSTSSKSAWKNRLTALRRFYQWARDTGRSATDPLHGITARDCPHSAAEPRRPGPQRRAAPSPVWATAIADYLDYLTAAARPATTRGMYRSRLLQLADAYPLRSPWEISAEELVSYLGSRNIGNDARRGTRYTLTGFYDWAVMTGRATANPAKLLPKIAPRPGVPRPIPDHLLAQACAVADPRQRLALRLAAEAGLRRAEIAQVHQRDVHRSHDGYTLLVHGKGQKQRMIPIPDALARLIGLEGTAWAFPDNKGGHLTADRIGHLTAQVLPSGYTLHTLRHRFATAAYNHTRDLYAVQRLLGHSNPQVTQRYVSLDTAELRPIVEALTAPSLAETPRPLELAPTGS